MGALMLLDDPGSNPPVPPTPPNPPPPAGDLKAVLDLIATRDRDGAAAVQKVIDDLRAENASHRTTNRDLSARWTKLAESVGLTKEATPEDVAAKLADNVSAVRSVRVERAVEKAANTHSADADLVMALIERDKALDGIADDKLTETADAKVKEYVEKRPNLKVVTTPPRPPRSGPHIEPGEPDPKPAGLSGALRERMIPA